MTSGLPACTQPPTFSRRRHIHHSIAYSLSNISAKNYRNRLMWVESIVCNISVVFWDTVYWWVPYRSHSVFYSLTALSSTNRPNSSDWCGIQKVIQLEDWHSEEYKLTSTYNTSSYTKLKNRNNLSPIVERSISCYPLVTAAPSGERVGLYTVCGNKKDPSTKTSISSKRRNIFVRNFQRLLAREFAIDDTSFVQYYASMRKWCDFWFSMRYFQVNAPCFLFKLKLQNNQVLA